MSITCVGGPLSGVTADLLIVPWFEDASAIVSGLDAATGGEIARALASKEFQAKPFEMFVTPITDRQWRGRRVALVGAGRHDACGGRSVVAPETGRQRGVCGARPGRHR
jgi:hypothetical protein